MPNQRPDSVIKRYNRIKSVIQSKIEQEKDPEELEFLQDDMKSFDELIDNMVAYTKSVFLDEQKNSNLCDMRKSANSTKDYQDAFEQLEKRRKTCHDSMISNIVVCDRLCELYGEDPIYGEMKEEFAQDVSVLKEDYNKPGVKEERKKIADWSFDFVISNTVALTLYDDPSMSEDDLKNYQKDRDSFSHIANAVKGKDLKGTLTKVINAHQEYDR